MGCCLSSCQSNFHFMCARARNCMFQLDRKVYCYKHRDLVSEKVGILHSLIPLKEHNYYTTEVRGWLGRLGRDIAFQKVGGFVAVARVEPSLDI